MEVRRWLGKVKYASAVMLESLDHPQTHVGEAGSPRKSKKDLYKILVHKPITAVIMSGEIWAPPGLRTATRPTEPPNAGQTLHFCHPHPYQNPFVGGSRLPPIAQLTPQVCPS